VGILSEITEGYGTPSAVSLPDVVLGPITGRTDHVSPPAGYVLAMLKASGRGEVVVSYAPVEVGVLTFHLTAQGQNGLVYKVAKEQVKDEGDELKTLYVLKLRCYEGGYKGTPHSVHNS